MNLSNALNFPFSNNNLVKILPIAIVYSIILFLSNYFAVTGNALLVCGAAIASLVFSLAIAGYYLSVLERLLSGNEYLPDVDVNTDVKRGCMSSLAAIMYMILPFIAFYALLFAGVLMSGSSTSSYDSGASGAALGGLLLICGGFVAFIVSLIVIGWALYIGMIRYVYEGQGLFSVIENFKMAWSNAGLGGGLLWRQFILGLIAGFVSVVVVIIQLMMFPEQYSLYFEPTLTYWIVFALGNVISYTVSLIFGLSHIHLVAQYGALLGFTTDERKRKNDQDSGGGIGTIIAIIAVVFLCVMPIIVIVVLTILGPTIGNVFSNIIQELGTPYP